MLPWGSGQQCEKYALRVGRRAAGQGSVVGWHRLEDKPDGLTGCGRCNLLLAILSPGVSNETTGAPNVVPKSPAKAPPRE